MCQDSIQMPVNSFHKGRMEAVLIVSLPAIPSPYSGNDVHRNQSQNDTQGRYQRFGGLKIIFLTMRNEVSGREGIRGNLQFRRNSGYFQEEVSPLPPTIINLMEKLLVTDKPLKDFDVILEEIKNPRPNRCNPK